MLDNLLLGLWEAAASAVSGRRRLALVVFFVPILTVVGLGWLALSR